MKLLTPQQKKDAKDAEQLKAILRTEELEKAAQKARHELANAEADFNATLANNRQQWAEEEEAHFKRANEMREEIAALEARKISALIPYGVLNDVTNERMDGTEAYVLNLKQLEQYNEELADNLQDKLDEVGFKEQDLIKRESALKSQELGLKGQINANNITTKRINTELNEFNAMKTKFEADMKTRQEALALNERNVAIKEGSFAARERSLQEQALRLADERGVLDRAWRELQKQKAKLSP